MEKIDIIFEDKYILVVDKPADFIVNRAQTHESHTMQDFAENRLDFGDEDEAGEFRLRSGIVHRLDKDTSGVLLIAKDTDTFEKLQAQFKEREVLKEYAAIACGAMTENKIIIDAPIARNPKNRMKMAVVSTGKPAVTEVNLVKNIKIENKDYSYLRIFPKTGRTHQIRVHLAAIGHPVSGDPIYCSNRQMVENAVIFKRMMLHAISIRITHPQTKEKIVFTSKLPRDFEKYI